MQEQNNVEDYLYFLKYRNNLTQFIKIKNNIIATTKQCKRLFIFFKLQK